MPNLFLISKKKFRAEASIIPDSVSCECVSPVRKKLIFYRIPLRHSLCQTANSELLFDIWLSYFRSDSDLSTMALPLASQHGPTYLSSFKQITLWNHIKHQIHRHNTPH